MLNHIDIMGRICNDIELRRTNSGVAVASFTLESDRDFKNSSGEKETDFVDIVAWKNTAEFVPFVAQLSSRLRPRISPM